MKFDLLKAMFRYWFLEKRSTRTAQLCYVDDIFVFSKRCSDIDSLREALHEILISVELLKLCLSMDNAFFKEALSETHTFARSALRVQQVRTEILLALLYPNDTLTQK